MSQTSSGFDEQSRTKSDEDLDLMMILMQTWGLWGCSAEEVSYVVENGQGYLVDLSYVSNSPDPICITTWHKSLHLRRRGIAQCNDNGEQSTYHLFWRHIKRPNTTSNKYYINYSTGSNIKLDWNAQVVHASFMRSPVIHCWKPRLTNHARLHTLMGAGTDNDL